MTNKEAISILKEHQEHWERLTHEKICPEDDGIETIKALEIAIKAIEERPQGECKSCRHRDPEDKKCDCGAKERQGCPFPVSDDYFCKLYDKGGAE